MKGEELVNVPVIAKQPATLSTAARSSLTSVTGILSIERLLRSFRLTLVLTCAQYSLVVQ